MRLKVSFPSAVKFAVVPLALGLLLTGSRTGHAQSDGGGALVLHGCPNMVTFPGHSDGYTYEVCADIVFAPNGNINATLHGQVLDPATGPSQAIIERGWPCVYGDQSTNDSQIVITPDGNVTGYCRLHND